MRTMRLAAFAALFVVGYSLALANEDSHDPHAPATNAPHTEDGADHGHDSEHEETSEHAEDSSHEEATHEEAAEHTEESAHEEHAPAPKPKLTVTKLQGRGRQATKKFDLQAGLFIVRIKHEGTSNFIVRLLDASGREDQTIFNEIGRFHGTRGFELRRGSQCLIDVEADGAWQIEIVQPRPETADPAPQEYQGSGCTVTPFISLNEGLTIFKLRHAGDSRFAAYLCNDQGRQIEQIVNVLGEFDGSKPYRVQEPGIYFLNVVADGKWEIEVE